jgi:hypothetical protein
MGIKWRMIDIGQKCSVLLFEKSEKVLLFFALFAFNKILLSAKYMGLHF